MKNNTDMQSHNEHHALQSNQTESVDYEVKKREFWKSKAGLMSIFLVAFLLLGGVVVGAYFFVMNGKVGVNNESEQSSLEFPDKNIEDKKPLDARFEVTVLDDEYIIKLGDEVVKTIENIYLSCNTNTLIDTPKPVVNRDGTKVYYVESSNPVEVKEIDVNKQERVFFTPQSPYKYIAGMAINSKDQFAYTLLQEKPFNCDTKEPLMSNPVFFVNSRYIDRPQDLNFTLLDYESIIYYGKSFILTKLIFASRLEDPNHDTNIESKDPDRVDLEKFILRDASDGSQGFIADGDLIYGNTDYAIVRNGLNFKTKYLDSSWYREHPELFSEQSIYKIDLNTGIIDTIVSNTLIRDIKIENGKMYVKYGGSLNDKFEYEGESKTLEYQL